MRNEIRSSCGMQFSDGMLPCPSSLISAANRVSVVSRQTFRDLKSIERSGSNANLTTTINDSISIWSSTRNKTSIENAFKHWKNHGQEFPNLQNSNQYVEATRKFIHNSPPGTLTKIRPNGDVVFYHPTSNTFAIKNQQGLPRTMYKPDPLIHNYKNNLEYFYGQ